jgi:hypothetical protein
MVLAVITEDDLDAIIFIHAPPCYHVDILAPTPAIDNHVFAILGNREGKLEHMELLEEAVGRATTRTLDDCTAIHTLLDKVNPRALAIADAHVPNTTACRVCCALVLHMEWATRAVVLGSLSPAGFYDEFLVPHAARLNKPHRTTMTMMNNTPHYKHDNDHHNNTNNSK